MRLLAFPLLLGLTAPALAQEPGPPPPPPVWAASVATIDFDRADGGKQFEEVVEAAHSRTLVYLDWTFRNAVKSGLFDDFTTEADPLAADQAICQKVEEAVQEAGGYVLSGKPNADNNHLLFSLKMDLVEGAPFARARCEYSGNAHSLRVRGFYYVTNTGTATAHNREFTPVAMPVNAVPPDLLQSLQ